MGTGQLLAVRRFSLRSSTTIDLSLLTFLSFVYLNEALRVRC